MPRFFFNFRQGCQYIADDSGIVFDTFELAYLDAYNSAREMWRELMSQRTDPRRCAFEITDIHGSLLASLPFTEVLESCGPRKRVVAADTEGTFASLVDTAYRARRTLSEFQRELERTHRNLSDARALIGSLERAMEPAAS